MVKTIRLTGVDLRALTIHTNPPPAPFPVITAALDTSVREPSSAPSQAVLQVFRISTGAGSLDYTSRVTIRTLDLTATNGLDYIALPPTVLRFDPGQTEKTVEVTLLPDATFEPGERFSLTLSNPVNAILDRTVQIVDILQTPRPALRIGDLSVPKATGTATLTVTRAETETGSLDYASSVRVVTHDGRSGGKLYSSLIGQPYLDTAPAGLPPGMGDDLDALRFNATSAMVFPNSHLPVFGGTPGNAFTVEAWIYPNQDGYIWNYGPTGGGQFAEASFELYRSGGTLYFRFSWHHRSNSYNDSPSFSLGAMAANQWHHVAICRSGNTTWAFLNGVRQWTQGLDFGNIQLSVNNGYPFVIGGYWATASFKGWMSDLRITDAAKYTGASYTPPETSIDATDSWYASTRLALPFRTTAMDITPTPAALAADAGDYSGVDTVVTFGAGETSKTVEVPLIVDAEFEQPEMFSVTLEDPTNATLFKDFANVTIVSTSLPTVKAKGWTVMKTSGSVTFELTRESSGAGSLAYTSVVSVATQNGTALSGVNYVGRPLTEITFLPGETEKTFEVEILDDGTYQPTIGFTLAVDAVENVTVTTPSAPASILSVVRPAFAINNTTAPKAGGTATFTVTRSGSPESLAYYESQISYMTQNGTALAGTHYVAVPTLTPIIFAPGETEKTVEITLLDNGTFEADKTFQVVIGNAVNATIADSMGIATVTSATAPTLSINDVTVSKTDGTAVFTITRTGTDEQMDNYPSSTVTVTSHDWESQAGVHYTQVPPTQITFTGRETTKTFTVEILDNRTYEADRVFSLHLTNAVGATITDIVGFGTITSLERPWITFEDVTDPVSKTEGKVVFTIVRDGPNIDYYTSTFYVTTEPISPASGTPAVAGIDYTHVQALQVKFDPGVIQTTVEITLNDDHEWRSDRQFQLVGTNPPAPVNAFYADNRATVTITSPEVPSFSIADVTAEEPDGFAVFTVTRTGPHVGYYASTVKYATEDDTAVAPDDYTAIPASTLSFAAGEATKQISVVLMDDGVREADQTFRVLLSDPHNATLSTATAVGTIISPDFYNTNFWPMQIGTARVPVGSAANDQFGRAMAVSGTTMAVSAYSGDNGATLDAGVIHLYEHNGTDWVQGARLTAGEHTRASAYFGYSLDLAGDILVVGAYGETASTGAAYVFVRTNGVWPTTPTARLVASDAATQDQFGYAVAVSGNTIAVGANLVDDPNPAGGTFQNSGAVYVFEGGGATWTEVAILNAGANRRLSAEFGVAVALEGDDLMIGAWREPISATSGGAVYNYTRTNGTWSLNQRIVPTTPVANSRFGGALDLHKGYLAVGAPIALGGYAYVFRKDGTTWIEEAVLTARTTTTASRTITDATVLASDNQGISVSLDMDWKVLLVGAHRNQERGAVYVYELAQGIWKAGVITPISKLVASDPVTGDNFGLPVVVSGRNVLIGASRRDIGTSADVGAFYVFRH